ncbi:MAG: M20/M25/M40 family metallo-hydrolase [Clostridia bacterium]|nr:M20/M25/M40 family metallo-hydrolase [Clostridia bacterium]
MAYEVSEKIRKAVMNVTEDANIRKGFDFIEEDNDYIIDKQIELTLIPAPTFNEGKKAQRLLEIFEEEGLSDCHIDDYGNVVGIRKGTGGGKTTLVEAHIDTVFPLDTKLEIKRENGFIYCPGITDNTRGDASVISIIRALNKGNVQTKGDIHFVGTVQEEGMGALRGMKYYLEHHPEIEASVSIDGSGHEGVVFEATGIQTYEINFRGKGGHAYGAYGDVANPLGAAGRAIAKITDIKVPESPRTTVAVTGAYAGSYDAVHAIVDTATITLNFRSNGHKELMELREKVFAAIELACAEETAHWGKDVITYDYRHLVDIDAGAQDAHSPIVEAAYEISKYLGCDDPELAEGGSTNCNRAIERGVPSVCLGMSRLFDSKCHTLAEQFLEKDAYKGCQQAYLLALLCAGTDAQESVI